MSEFVLNRLLKAQSDGRLEAVAASAGVDLPRVRDWMAGTIQLTSDEMLKLDRETLGLNVKPPNPNT